PGRTTEGPRCRAHAMSTTEPPLVNARSGRPDDDLDRLLHDFFQAELPRSWPAAPTPKPIRLPELNGHTALPLARPAQPTAQPWAWTSHLALAASVGGLLLGTLLLSGQFKGNEQPAPDPNLGAPAANVHMKEMLVQPPDGPTSMKFEFTDPF